MKLYLATGNPHKIGELKEMLGGAGLAAEVFGPEAVGGMPEVVEDQGTFSGNALKKARALAELIPAGAFALADDSGLCVEALDGAPGVYSARFAGEDATDDDNIDKLLLELEQVPTALRGAAFECHLAVVSSVEEEWVFKGKCEGAIVRERTGGGGFGYDPIFVPKGFAKSFAELSRSEKATLSHRGLAMRDLLVWLRERS